MFSRQKAQLDIKKSTQKILDRKKDTPTKLKHLRHIFDSFDLPDVKALLCKHYEPIYKIVYEGIVTAETNLKQRGVHRAQREELESALYLLEKILVLCPDNLYGRWQLHSLSRLMAKLYHPENTMRLRREGIRLFLIWYQCLGENSPMYIHKVFASLVPGFGVSSAVWPQAADEPLLGVSPLEITPIIPVSSGGKHPDDSPAYYLECILDFMVSQAPKIQWNDGPEMWAKSINFLYERFKEYYVPKIFPNFELMTDIYKPVLELPDLRKNVDVENNFLYTCQVVFTKWIANYVHSVYRSTDCYQPTNTWKSQSTSLHQKFGKPHSSPHSSISGDSLATYSSAPIDIDANVLAKDVILGTRKNINLLHEIFRRALLLPFIHSAAIRRVICVYKDWIQINVPELPVFILEPEERDTGGENRSPYDAPKNRLRADSYYGAVGCNANNNREEHLLHLRAGAQKVLRVFFCNSSAVFLHGQTPKAEGSAALLEEQVDICKRVLNIYRYAVMNTRMDPHTWEQLLVVMLHVSSTVLDLNHSRGGPKHQNTLGQKLASAMFQTLIVSWVKASLNVPILVELWDHLESVLSQLTMFDELVSEWAKTMETLTRVLARHVYNLDLTSLPLDLLTDRKGKRKRGVESRAPKSMDIIKQVSGMDGGKNCQRNQNFDPVTSSKQNTTLFPQNIPNSQSTVSLKRSWSEGNMFSPKNSVVDVGCEELKTRKTRRMSKSMDSLRRAIPKEDLVLSHTSGTHQSDWAEISSSTTSLENTSNIHADDVSLGNEYHSSDREELKGVIAGGKIKGWLPSVAAILWRRMLGILGNVNRFQNPRTHAHFFQVISDMWHILRKIRKNQGVTSDNLSTPMPPLLVPPLLLPAPWCFEALDLPPEFDRGKVLASALMCDITLSNEDVPFHQEYLCKFYSAIHKCIIFNNQYIINEIVNRSGLWFVSKMLPGFTLLLLDLVQASHTVLSSDDLRNSPRVEATTLLGSVLGVSDVFKDFKVLRPKSAEFQSIDSHYTKLVMSYLIQTVKVEQTSLARVVALQSLTIYLCKELMQIRYLTSSIMKAQSISHEEQNMLYNIFAVLIAAVQVTNTSVVILATDSLLMLSEFATEIKIHFPNIGRKIIVALKSALERAIPFKNSNWTSGGPGEIEKRLFISLILTLGEWCMRTPIEGLLDEVSSDDEQLFPAVFRVLQMVVKGYQTPGRKTAISLDTSLEGFNPSILLDTLHYFDGQLRDQSDTISKPYNFQTVKLAARSLMSYLLTQHGHFPISNYASRCYSIVSENDDLGFDEIELNLHIFSLPNLQMFVVDDETLLTLIELPADYSIGYNVKTQAVVRIILRDLNGKACWDATNLLSRSANGYTDGDEISAHVPSARASEEQWFQSAITGSFFPQIGPRLTVRHRHIGYLPTLEDSADDLDNLDDLLEYIGHTSPECLLKSGESLTTPWVTPASVTQEQEDDVVGSIVNQRIVEFEYLSRMDSDVMMRGKRLQCSDDLAEDEEDNLLALGASSHVITNLPYSSFLQSRRFFSQFALNGSEKRSNIYLLNKDEKLLREIKHLDNQKCRESHKIAVIYVAHGQEDKQSILYNTAGSELFEDFVSGLGWEVELETHTGFMGGLQRNRNSGETAPYFATSFSEVIFHVATRLPSDTEESLLQKTRHLGNDEVHIVWSEHKRDYRRDIIPTEFCDVLIVIYPLQYGLFRVQISKKPEIPYFGPLHNEVVISADVLAPLVRATAVNASRARQSSLPHFQLHFQERAKTLSTIIQNHKIRTTFEQFTGNVISPLLPTASFLSGTNSRASGTSFTSTVRASSSSSTNSANLAASHADQSISSSQSSRQGAPPRRMTTGPNFLSSFSPYENVMVSPSTGKISHLEHSHIPNDWLPSDASISPIPPVPPRRLEIKLNSSSKQKLETPPASPATSLRSTNGSINDSDGEVYPMQFSDELFKLAKNRPQSLEKNLNIE